MRIQIPLFDSRKDNRIEFDQTTPIVVNVSGGKDSSALLIWMKAHYPHHQITALYCDTGFEHPGVLQYIQSMTNQLNVPHVVIRSDYSLLSLVQYRRVVPTVFCRFCTSRLKQYPADKWIRKTFPNGNVVQCFGFRAEESPARAKKSVLAPYPELCTRNREVLFYAPLLDWRTDDVVGLVQSEGFQLFPTYEYLSRLSCRYCFLAGKRDHDATRINDPEGYEQVQQVLETIGTPANNRLHATPGSAAQNSLFH